MRCLNIFRNFPSSSGFVFKIGLQMTNLHRFTKQYYGRHSTCYCLLYIPYHCPQADKSLERHPLGLGYPRRHKVPETEIDNKRQDRKQDINPLLLVSDAALTDVHKTAFAHLAVYGHPFWFMLPRQASSPSLPVESVRKWNRGWG